MIVDLGHPQPIGAEEVELGTPLDYRVAALVQQSVMISADADEVIKARLAAISPVLDMMTIDELRAVAARESAAAIAALQGPADGRWNHPGLAADVQRFAVAARPLGCSIR